MDNKHMLNYYADENVVRILAAFVALLTIIALGTQSQLIIFFLITDFALRAFTFQSSPLSMLAKQIVKAFQLSPKSIFATPKRFAAGLGFIFSLIVFILFVLGIYPAAYTVGTLLIFCAVLESAFKICLGCYLFSWIIAPFNRWKNKENHSKQMDQES